MVKMPEPVSIRILLILLIIFVLIVTISVIITELMKATVTFWSLFCTAGFNTTVNVPVTILDQ